MLLTRTPYGRDLAVNSAYLNPATVAAAGFVVILQDCRGRFGSDGVFDPSVNEASDGAAPSSGQRRLPYSNGVVGMWGRSYFAETQWRAARARPAGLAGACSPGVSAGGQREQRVPLPRRGLRARQPADWGHASASRPVKSSGNTAATRNCRAKELRPGRTWTASFSDGSASTRCRYGSCVTARHLHEQHVLPSAARSPGQTAHGSGTQPPPNRWTCPPCTSAAGSTSSPQTPSPSTGASSSTAGPARTGAPAHHRAPGPTPISPASSRTSR